MKRTAGLIIFAMILTLFAPAGTAQAEEKFALTKTKLTLFPGNTYQLEYSGVTDSGWTDWWGWYYSPVSFSTSDSQVAVVDYNGLVRAVGVGTATITAWYDGKEATCRVTVRANSCRLDKTKLVLYQGQETTVKLTSKKKAKGYSYYISNADETAYADDYGVSAQSAGRGGFILRADTVGRYYVDFVINATDGKDYSARCEVEVLPCGLASECIAVANGEKKQIVLENASLISCGTEQEGWYCPAQGEDTADTDGENWNVYSGRAEVSVDANGVITAKKPGNTELTVTYETAYGKLETKTLNVHVTQPEFIPFTDSLWVGDYYMPEFTGTSQYSEITASSGNEEVLAVERDMWNGTLYLVPRRAGTAVLSVSADGASFQQEVTVINPRLSAYVMVLTKGKTKNLKVTGAEKGSSITFSSSDKSVASVTKTGKITAKKKGAALITVTIDGRSLYCTVTVGTGKGAAAVRKAEAVLGAAYSQDKRMQKGYYDCSSLVWRSYNEAGLKLAGTSYAPTAAELARKLEAEGKVIAYEYVSADELKQGDIIFYQGYSNGRYKNIDHAALFYGANYVSYGWEGEEQLYNTGMIIHASGDVHMREYDSYRTGTIVMIARPVK